MSFVNSLDQNGLTFDKLSLVRDLCASKLEWVIDMKLDHQ